jgi:hypothetical protein
MTKTYRYILAAAAIAFPFFGQLVAQSEDRQSTEKNDPDAQDMDALKRWITDKRFITMKEIAGDLSLSGEVRTEFQAASEVANGVQQKNYPHLPPNDADAKPMYGWDIEFNLMLDYRTERTWAAVKLEFDNNMGQRSGTVDKIALEKAYAGGRIIAGDTFTMDAELGRRYLFIPFESKIEFSSLFDGILFRFNKAFESVGSFYFNGAMFLVNDLTNHYGWVGELGALKIGNTGLNMKYSAIDWYRPGSETEKGNTAFESALTNQRYRFLISQFLIYYQLYPEWIGKRLIKIYAAGLMNHLALSSKMVADAKAGGVLKQIIPTGGRKENLGAYIGVSIGTAKKRGDWALDANYQWVQQQAVPDFDSLGIGRGNTAKVGTYTNNISGKGGATTQATAVGNTNFKGFEIEGLYAITDNLVVQQNFKYSNTLDKNIGPNINYKQYEMEFIYAF